MRAAKVGFFLNVKDKYKLINKLFKANMLSEKMSVVLFLCYSASLEVNKVRI